ncbi:unnamed protein product, partial [Discosporangium mesarthrocarpum]
DSYGGQKVAILVPYIGAELPVWWDVFAQHAGYNDGLVDWLIFCDEASYNTPPNVKFHPMDTERMAWLLAGVVEAGDIDTTERSYASQQRNRLTPHLEMLLVEEKFGKSSNSSLELCGENHDAQTTHNPNTAAHLLVHSLSPCRPILMASPYFLVEFKPALGWLFRDYIAGYSHWGYGDLDVLFGNMQHGWLEAEELRDFDVLTFSFGDQYRAYLRGQLTIQKNVPEVNQVWRACGHFARYRQRLEQSAAGGRPMRVESAEGCYSLAVSKNPSLRIKFAVKALSDVGMKNESSSQAVYVQGNGQVMQCPSLAAFNRAGEERGRDGTRSLLGLPHTQKRMQGRMVRVGVKRAVGGDRCEHWVKDRYQTCLDNVTASDTLFLYRGTYFKQGFRDMWEEAHTAGEGCRAGALYHFQRYKVNYRSWNTRPQVPPVHVGMTAGPNGLVPLPADGWRIRSVNPLMEKPAKPHKGRPEFHCRDWVTRKK